MKILKEIAHFLRFLKKTAENEKEIVFYAEHRDYYPNFEGIIDELLTEYGQPFCYITSDIGDPVFKHPDTRVKAFYIDKLLPFLMVMVKCKVFIMTLTDLNRYHLKRSSHPVHYVYVFHSMVSTHMMYRRGAFDHYDSILCVGPHHVREFRAHEKQDNLPEKQLIEAGYYRLERIYAKYRERLKEKKDSAADKRPVILVAPSWGKQNVIESCGRDIVDVLLKSGFEVIVRPHPETLRRSRETVDALEKEFKGNGSFTLERSVASDDSLLRADVLISDCSGVTMEYAFGTERPVIFMDVPYKIQNDRYTELGIEPLELSLMPKTGVKVSPEELETLPGVIDALLKKKEEYREEIATLREEYVYSFNNSSKISVRHILEVIRSKKE
jgi:CDP-glycerol glycerophosphotransferase (TagB/SpsB family)